MALHNSHKVQKYDMTYVQIAGYTSVMIYHRGASLSEQHTY